LKPPINNVMAQAGRQQRPLSEVNADLDSKLGSIAPLSWIKARLSKKDIIDGLKSEAGAEFFARSLTRMRSAHSITHYLGDAEVQDAFIGMLERNPKAVGEAVERHADTLTSRKRLRALMECEAGRGLYGRVMGTAAGNELTSMIYDYPVAWSVWGKLNRGVKRTALWAKIKMPQAKYKQSVEVLQPYIRPAETRYLEAGGGELVDDARITALLNDRNLDIRYGTITEFFTSTEKRRRLSQFLEKPGGRDLLTNRLRENKPRALLSILDSLAYGLEDKTGIKNFAEMLVDENGYQVIKALAQGSLEDQELIFAAFNAHYTPTAGQEKVLLGKEVMGEIYRMGEIRFDRAVEILDAVNDRRRGLYASGIITRGQVRKGLGDIPLPEAQLEEIRRARG
jgi:hypothetical protein